MVGEVGFAENEEPGNRAFEGVVNPKTAHCVVRSGVYAHGCFVRVFARDAFVHVEEVAVLFLDRFKAVALDCVGKVEVNAASFAVDCRPYAASVVAGFLCRARGDVAGSEVAERGILSFQIVVAVFFGDFRRLLCAVFLLLGNPHAAVVAERFAHERELALLVAVLRNAGGVDLREAGVCEARAALVAAESRRDAATLRVCGEVEYVAVAARAEQNRVGGVSFDGAVYEVADDDALCRAVNLYEVEHFAAGVHLDLAEGNLSFESRVRAEEELLPRLSAGVERAADLRAAERAVRQKGRRIRGRTERPAQRTGR